MTRATDELIATLSAEAAPVRRLSSPGVRAAAWLAAIAVVAAAAVFAWSDLADFWRRNGQPQDLVALASALAAGIAAVTAAYHLAIPGRSRAWALAPLPFLAAWLGASGYGCLRLSLSGSAEHGDSSACFMFILVTSLPLGALLFWRLRVARPLAPRLVATLAALGVAALSAVVLQFFHGFDVTWLDLAVHAAAVLVVAGVGGLAARLLGSGTAPPRAA